MQTLNPWRNCTLHFTGDNGWSGFNGTDQRWIFELISTIDCWGLMLLPSLQHGYELLCLVLGSSLTLCCGDALFGWVSDHREFDNEHWGTSLTIHDPSLVSEPSPTEPNSGSIAVFGSLDCLHSINTFSLNVCYVAGRLAGFGATQMLHWCHDSFLVINGIATPQQC